jgi:nitroimidazol reductase NimA-like FMN-containing flavoprotein (pyridoxamine 5'-phosphate oxidase superfamily)
MARRPRAGARSSRPARVPRKAAALVTWERVCRVATVNAEGVPHVVPVCHIFHEGRIYFGSGKDATKVKNLEANPRATVTVDSYSDEWSSLRGVMVQGTTRVIGRGGRFRTLRARLYRKYPQYPGEAALGESDSVIVEVTPTRVFAWGLE